MTKPTIKRQVIGAIAKAKKVTRMDIQRFIWTAQGSNLNDFVYRQGYYGVNIQQWVGQNLIKRVKRGVYVITKQGIDFVANPSTLYQRRKAERDAYKLKDYSTLRQRVWDLEQENYQLKRNAPQPHPPQSSRTRVSHLVGRVITSVRMMSSKEALEVYGWDYQPVVITLDNGTELIPQSDDEGNNAGALCIEKRSTGQSFLIPVSR